MAPAVTPLSFTKLVVADLERMERFYTRVYGLERLDRVESHIGDEAIEEVILGAGGGYAGGLILLRFVDRSAPAGGEAILGFTTDDADALLGRLVAEGGSVHAAIRDEPEAGYRVGFARDPEGHLSEIVELLSAG